MADRSVAIRIAVKDVQETRRRLASLGADGKAALEQIERGGPGASRSLSRIEREARTLGRTAQNLRRDFRTLGAGLATFGVGFTLATQIRELTQAAVSVERIENTLSAATGTFATVGRDFAFIREQAVRLGLDLETISGSYARLSASALRAGANTEDVRNIFVAFTEASRVLGLETEAIDGVFRAIDQSFTKFTVSAEELRQQLGDRLPGAFTYAAQAMGVTGQELDRLIRTNQVLATDLFPRMAEVIQRTFGPAVERSVDSLQATLGRLQTAFFEIRVEFARSGFIDEFAAGIERVTDALGNPEIRSNLRDIGAFLGDTVAFVVENASTLIAVSTALAGAFVAARIGGVVGEAVGGRRGGAIGKLGAGIAGAIGAGAATALGLSAEDAETLRTDLAGAVATLTDEAESATRRVEAARVNLAEIRAETAQVEREMAAATALARERAPAVVQEPAADLLAGLDELQTALAVAAAMIEATGAEGLTRAEAALHDFEAAQARLLDLQAEQDRVRAEIRTREARLEPLREMREVQRGALPGLQLPPLDLGVDQLKERAAALGQEVELQREGIAVARAMLFLDERRADAALKRLDLVSEQDKLQGQLAEAETQAFKELTGIARDYATERERVGERRAEAVAELRLEVEAAERLLGAVGAGADEQRRLQATIEGVAAARELDLDAASAQGREIVDLTVRLSDLEAEAASAGAAFERLREATAGLRAAQAGLSTAALPGDLADQASDLAEALSEAREAMAGLGPAAREAFQEAVRAEALTLGIDLDTAEARAQIDAFLADEAGRRFLIGVDADVSAAEREFATLQATIERTRREAERIATVTGLATDIGRELAAARTDMAGFQAALAAGAQGFSDLRTEAGRAFDLQRRAREFRTELEGLSAAGVERVVEGLRAAGVELDGLVEARNLDALAGALARGSQEAAVLRDRMQQTAETGETIADVMVETLSGAFDRIVERGADTFEDLFAGAGFQVDDFAEGMVQTIRRAFAEIAAFAIIRPILAPVAGQLLGGGAPGVAGPAGAGGQVGVLTQSIGGLQGAIDKLGANLGFAGGAVPPQSAATLTGSLLGRRAGPFGDLTLSRLMGGAAFGGLTAAAFAPMFGLHSTGAGFGGAAGTAGGLLAASSPALAPLLGPLAPFAPLLGGAAGGLLGGVLGNLFQSKPSGKAQAAAVDLATGRITATGQEGDKFSEANRRIADELGRGLATFSRQLAELTGGGLTGTFNLVVSDRGSYLERGGPFAGGERLDVSNPEELARLAVRETLRGLKDADPAIQRRIGRISTESPEAALADVQLIKTFTELTGRSTALDASLRQLAATFDPLFAAADRLALPTRELTRAYEEQRGALIDAANAQIDALAFGEAGRQALALSSQIDTLKTTFREAIRNADELGRSEGELYHLRGQAIRRVREDVLASLPRPANDNAAFSIGVQREQEQSIRDQFEAARQVVRANRELGISERQLADMRRRAIRATQESFAAERKRIIGGVFDQARALADTNTDLGTQQRRELAAMRDQFREWRATLRAYGRDVDGLDRLQRRAAQGIRERIAGERAAERVERARARAERARIREDIIGRARALAEGGDLPFGRETRRQLREMRSQFDEFRESLRAVGVETRLLNRLQAQAAEALRRRRVAEARAQIEGIEGQLRGEGARIRALVDQFAGPLKDALREITAGAGSTLSAGGRLRELQAEFRETSTQALRGQVDAIERLPQLALELDRLRTEFGGRAVQAPGQAEIARVLEKVEAIVRQQGRRAEADLPGEFRAGTRFLGDVFRGDGELTRAELRQLGRKLDNLERQVTKLRGRNWRNAA